MQTSPKVFSRQHRRVAFALAGTALALWLAVLTRAPLEPASEPSAASELPSLEPLAQQNARTLEATRKRLASEWQSTHISAETEQGRAAERFLDSAFALHAARTMYNRDALQAAEYERIAADPAAVALAKRLAVDAEEAERVFGPDQAFVRVYAVRTLRHLSQKDPEVAAEAVERLGSKLNENTARKKGIEHDYVELLAAYSRSVGVDAILRDPDRFMQRARLTPRTSLEFNRALHDSGILSKATSEQMAKLQAAYDRLAPKG